METLWKDIQYGARMLVKNPGFTLVAAFSLALGIGVNSTIFTLVNALLLKPLPVSEPQELVEIYTGRADQPYLTTSYLDYVDFREENDVFSGLAAHSLMGVMLTVEGHSEVVLGETVSGNYFDVMGVRPVLGRTFLPEEDRAPDTHPVAVVSHGFWQRRFGGDPSLLGKSIRINGTRFTVVGIAPESFTSTLSGFTPELWVPMMMSEEVQPWAIMDVEPSPTGETRLERRGTRWLLVKGRLRPDVTLDQAQAQMRTIFSRLEQEYPETNEDRTVHLLSASGVQIHPELDQALTPAAVLILAVVGMVLLIACANVANMLLSRATARRQEIAIRLAMGAGRVRLLRQLLTESFLLSILGGIGGLVLATWSSRLLSAFKPPGNTNVILSFGVDGRVFLFTLGLAMLAGLLFGLAPAFRATRLDLVASLKKEAARHEGIERRFGLRNLLVIGQVTVTMILLVGASLLVRSLQNARSMDVGFELDQLAVMEIDLELHNYSEATGKAFYQRVIERVHALPEVSSATLVRRLPLTLNRYTEGIYIERHQQSPDDMGYPVDYTRVGPGYFKTIGIPLLEGRDLNDSDTEDGPRVAVINETMARTYWPDESPIGERFHIDEPTGPSVEIVGVCGDYNVRTVGEDPRPYMHFSTTQGYSAHNNLLVRTAGDPAAAVATLRREILAIDPNILFFESTTLASLIEITLVPVRMGAGLIGGFGLLGMMLAAVGLYGVVAYSVSRRTHELGLRMALGATTTDVIRMVLKKGMTVVLVGVALGLLGSALLSRLLAAVLYDVSPLDPVSFGAASLFLLVVAVVANYLPARRATRVEPVVALRYE